MDLQKGQQSPFDVLAEIEKEILKEHQETPFKDQTQAEWIGLSIYTGEMVLITPLDEIMEIVRVPQIIPISHFKPFIRGIATSRGEIFTVADLGTFLTNRKPMNTTNSRILLIQQRNELIGMVVDRVFGLQRLPENAIDKTQATSIDSLNPYTIGVLQNKHAQIPIISCKKIMSSPTFGMQHTETSFNE